MMEEKPDFVEFPQDKLDSMHEELNSSEVAKEYFKSRGIEKESMEYFKLGFSAKQNMVIVPVHSPDGKPVGLVGRSISEKKFKNSTNLPRSKTMFNIHRAKKIGDHVIIVESSFDAIKVHQSGFPNVVATLGGHISNENLMLLNRYFNKITIMTDADQAGRELGMSIANKLRYKNILWASFDYGKIYPHEAKDAGDMTEQEIKTCIKNAVSDIEYRSWK
jgi:DNA primase